MNIPAEGYASWAEVVKELKEFPADIPAYVRLNVLLKDAEVLPYDRQSQLANILEGKEMVKCVQINPTREVAVNPSSEKSRLQNLTMQELQKTAPVEILKSYAQQTGEVFTEEFEKMLETVIKNINSVQDED